MARPDPTLDGFGRPPSARALALLSAIALLACAHPARVAIDERPDLAACRSWSWAGDPGGAAPGLAPELDGLVRGAIERELLARGFARAPDGETGEFLVGYRLQLTRELVSRAEAGPQQRLETYGSGGGSSGTASVFEIVGTQRRLVGYEAGTLHLDVAQGATPRVVWSAVWQGRVRQEFSEHVDGAVEAVFEEFPAGPAADER